MASVAFFRTNFSIKYILLLLLTVWSIIFIYILTQFNFGSVTGSVSFSFVWRNLRFKWTEEEVRPIIIVWTSMFGRKEGKEKWKVTPVSERCLNECEILIDRERIQEADAIVFHAWPGDLNNEDLPSYRRADQVWVFMAQESPYLTPKGLEKFNGVFNWTMTYRMDSDVRHLYGKSVKTDEIDEDEENKRIDEILKKKQKFVAGVMSNCKTASNREKLVEKMRQFIPVDIYGKCGMETLKRNDPNEGKFWDELGANYKFYLPFENALCIDYITEKFWRALRYGMVPVVYGGGNYSSFAPPNSFINVMDFETVKELTEYLDKVGNDEVEFRQYLAWRKHYKLKSAEGLYSLCKKMIVYKKKLLRDTNDVAIMKVKEDLRGWWEDGGPNGGKSCRSPENF